MLEMEVLHLSLLGKWHFRRVGSKMKGSLYPDGFAGSAPMDFGSSTLLESTPSAIALRKPTAYRPVSMSYSNITFDTHSFGMPPPAVPFKPAQMPSATAGAHNHIWIALDLRIRHGLIARNRIISCVQAQCRYSDC